LIKIRNSLNIGRYSNMSKVLLKYFDTFFNPCANDDFVFTDTIIVVDYGKNEDKDTSKF